MEFQVCSPMGVKLRMESLEPPNSCGFCLVSFHPTMSQAKKTNPIRAILIATLGVDAKCLYPGLDGTVFSNRP